MVANQNTTALSIIDAVKSDPMVIETQNRLNEVKAIHQAVFQKGVHYGAPYKGAKNDTLLKPGATFLQQKYGLHEQHERLETTIHVDVNDLSKSYIMIQDRCRIFDSNGQEIAQCDAACTTFEDKYVYRGGGDKVCPDCGGTVLKSKFADRQTGDMGWYCKDCKHNFVSTDEKITKQDTTKKLNPNPLNLLDTIVAMAQKRAAVRATIKATGVDALFSPGDGVTVDYYDDMDQSNEDLIAVVAKNAPPTNVEPPSSAGAENQVSDSATPKNGVKSEKTPAQRLGTPHGQRIGADKPFVYDRIKLFMEAAKVKALADLASQERNNTIIAMEGEGAFKDAADYQQCVEMVIARVNSPEHGKGKKAKASEVEF